MLAVVSSSPRRAAANSQDDFDSIQLPVPTQLPTLARVYSGANGCAVDVVIVVVEVAVVVAVVVTVVAVEVVVVVIVVAVVVTVVAVVVVVIVVAVVGMNVAHVMPVYASSHTHTHVFWMALLLHANTRASPQ